MRMPDARMRQVSQFQVESLRRACAGHHYHQAVEVAYSWMPLHLPGQASSGSDLVLHGHVRVRSCLAAQIKRDMQLAATLPSSWDTVAWTRMRAMYAPPCTGFNFACMSRCVAAFVPAIGVCASQCTAQPITTQRRRLLCRDPCLAQS